MKGPSVISKDEANNFEKSNVELFDYFGEDAEEADILRVSCEEGHLEEFYDDKSTFLYFIIEGKGTFYLDEKPKDVEKGDLVVAPPKTKIYYLGDMELLLVCSPPWSEENEHSVRYLNKEGETVEKE